MPEITKLNNKYCKLCEELQYQYSNKSRDILRKKIIKKIRIIYVKLIEFQSSAEKGILLQKLINNGKFIKTKLESLYEDLSKPFLLFFVGMGKYGKSTLINALLKQNIADIDILPKTWKIDIYQNFSGNDDAEVEIIFKDKNTQKYDFQSARKFLEDEEIKRISSEEEIFNEFKNNINKFHSTEEKEEYKDFLETKMLYKSPVLEVRWPVKQKDEILKNFRLVDTPGLMQELLGEIRMSINEYYFKADGVIWILDATKISARKPKEIISDLNTSLNEIGGRTDNVIAVINRIDIIREKGGNKAVGKICNKAKNIFEDVFQNIIPISAKEALEGVLKENKKLMESSGILELKKIIEEEFQLNAKKIQTTSKELGIKKLQNTLINEVEKYLKKLNYDMMKRAKYRKDLKIKIQKLEDDIYFEFNTIIKEQKRIVYENIKNKSENLLTKEDGKKDFILNEILEDGKLICKLNKLNVKIDKSIIEFIDSQQENAKINEYEYIHSPLKNQYFNTDIEKINKSGHFNYEDETAGNALGGVVIGAAAGTAFMPGIGTIIGGLLGGLLGSIRSYFNRASKIQEFQSKIRENFDKSINKLIDDKKNSISKKISGINGFLLNILNKSFRNIHCEPELANELFHELKDLIKNLKYEEEYSNKESIKILIDYKTNESK